MTRLASAAAIVAVLLALPAAAAGGAQGLCRADETCYFCCQIGGSGKLLSLCGKALGTAAGGHLQYRFGRRSRAELVFPEKTEGSAGAFLFADYMRAGVSRAEVRFVSGDVEYSVFDYFEDEARRSGVRVVTGGLRPREIEFVCSGRRQSRLGMLKDVLACDRESALGGISCP